MKVLELIELLKGFDPELDVLIDTHPGDEQRTPCEPDVLPAALFREAERGKQITHDKDAIVIFPKDL